MFSRDVGARDRSNVAERKIQSMGAENTQRLFSTLITLDQQKSCFVSVLVKTFLVFSDSVEPVKDLFRLL